MARVTNLTRSGMEFVVGVRGGAAVTKHLPAGETRDLEIDVESATVKGRLAIGAIRIGAPARRATAKTETAG